MYVSIRTSFMMIRLRLCGSNDGSVVYNSYSNVVSRVYRRRGSLRVWNVLNSVLSPCNTILVHSRFLSVANVAVVFIRAKPLVHAHEPPPWRPTDDDYIAGVQDALRVLTWCAMKSWPLPPAVAILFINLTESLVIAQSSANTDAKSSYYLLLCTSVVRVHDDYTALSILHICA